MDAMVGSDAWRTGLANAYAGLAPQPSGVCGVCGVQPPDCSSHPGCAHATHQCYGGVRARADKQRLLQHTDCYTDCCSGPVCYS